MSERGPSPGVTTYVTKLAQKAIRSREALPAAIEAVIREVIERCAVAVEDAGGDNEDYHAAAVRALGGGGR